MSSTLALRSLDGSGNNLADPAMNAAGTVFARYAPARYADGISAPVSGPNPRTVSNAVVGEGDAAVPNSQGLSGMMYAWGQFIDHDLTRTLSDGVTRFDITVPEGDPWLAGIVRMTRAVTGTGTGTDPAHPATPVNAITGWLDASMVYGSDAATAAALRLPDGRMRVSAGDNLPVENGAFHAGDVRAGENPSLTALHTLFVREHNHQVARLSALDPSLTGDQLYELARAIVAAEIAHITYAEFLPHLLGPRMVPDWTGYDPGVDARLRLEFAGAAWRWGHSTVSNETERKDELGNVVGPDLSLRDAFFLPPDQFAAHSGADGFLRHLATDRSQAMDARIVEDLRNFLFDPPVGQDLAALNIQRGRDVGLPTLNGAREAMGLAPYTDFAQITDDAATVAALRSVFTSVEEVDLWTGGLSERLVPGGFVGETFAAIIRAQFTALRDGDRFWYESQGFDPDTLAMIEGTTLSDIVLRNTDTEYLQPDMFVFFERRAADAAPEVPDAPQLVVSTADGQVVRGGPQGDLLVGREGAQTVTGGEGDDTIQGGAGRDVLDGGRGRDLFRYEEASDSRPDAPDLVTDFRPGEDRIDLSLLGELDWIGSRAFSRQGEAELRYDRRGLGGQGHALLLDLDGDGIADMAIQIRGAGNLSSGDLIL
ncbi:MAG TPA: peroxidase family protein [Acetobacteraceae bacterium]|nr:peroxidase family protein [Acetobacteraceae bacterium]